MKIRKSRFYLVSVVSIILATMFAFPVSAYTKIAGITKPSESGFIYFSNKVPQEAQNEFNQVVDHYRSHGISFRAIGPIPTTQPNFEARQEYRNYGSSSAKNDGYNFIYYNNRGTSQYLMQTMSFISGNQVIGFDMDINSSFDWGIDRWYNSKYDWQNAFVHEVGHYLGLNHSSDKEASMFSTMNKGETKKRTLENDDLNGFRSLGYSVK